MLQQKLNDVLEGFSKMNSLTELDLTLQELAKLDKIKVTFDLKKRQIEMSSES